jgi:hypothetical protein
MTMAFNVHAAAADPSQVPTCVMGSGIMVFNGSFAPYRIPGRAYLHFVAI